jgi:hypothetical protein
VAPRKRFLRREDGSIRAVVSANDPDIGSEWLWDRDVRAFFEAIDRAVRRRDWLAAGLPADDLEQDQERAVQRLRDRMLARRWR